MFDAQGFLQYHEDRQGRRTTFVYSDDYDLLQIKSPTGKILDITMDEKGRITEAGLPDGTQVSYEYDEDGNLVQYTNQAGDTRLYEYDDSHRMTAWYDENGTCVTANVYDGEGCVMKQTDGNGNTAVLTYADGCTTVTDNNGNITEYCYDSQYRTTRIVYPDGSELRYTYDENGYRSSETDELGNTTAYTYDWTVNGNEWDPASPIGDDVTVTGDLRIVDVKVTLTVEDGYLKATVDSGVTLDASKTVHRWAHLAYDGGEPSIETGSASYPLAGPGYYAVEATVYDSNGVSGTAEAALAYSTPGTPETSFDIEHDGDSASIDVVGDTVIITSSGDHDDVDIALGFGDTASIEINGSVGSGAVTNQDESWRNTSRVCGGIHFFPLSVLTPVALQNEHKELGDLN